MIKTKILITTLFVLFMVGCGQPAPTLNNLNNPTVDNNSVDTIKDTTVTIDENKYGTDNIKDVNKGFNSSKDGFRSIYFDFNQYSISDDMRVKVNYDAKEALTKSSKIKIAGNCDEFGTDEYNYALGLKRAKVVKDTLVSKGVSSNKILLVSLGESTPICSSVSEECYKRNRRVDLSLAK